MCQGTDLCNLFCKTDIAVIPPNSSGGKVSDQIEAISDATALLVDQQDVTPLGLAFQAIELQTSDDALDAALRRVLRAMKV